MNDLLLPRKRGNKRLSFLGRFAVAFLLIFVTTSFPPVTTFSLVNKAPPWSIMSQRSN